MIVEVRSSIAKEKRSLQTAAEMSGNDGLSEDVRMYWAQEHSHILKEIEELELVLQAITAARRNFHRPRWRGRG